MNFHFIQYLWNELCVFISRTFGWDLPSCQVSLNFVQRRSKKCLGCQGSHLVFQIGPKNTNVVEDIEILLPIKFSWIPFSVFRGEVENVSANQRPISMKIGPSIPSISLNYGRNLAKRPNDGSGKGNSCRLFVKCGEEYMHCQAEILSNHGN